MTTACMRRDAAVAALAVAIALLAGARAWAQPAAGSAPAGDLQRIKERLVERRLDTDADDANRAEALMASMKPDGSWEDIDYVDQGSASFKPAEHVQRLVTLARAWAQPLGRLHNDKTVRNRIEAGMTCWLTRDPKSTNWWWNEIGAPQGIADLLLLGWEGLSAESRRGGLKILARSWPHPSPMTGENLVWVARIGMVRGCLEPDEAMVKDAARAIASTMTITEKEGVQPDFSFHQHGAQLYSGGYGMGFATDCAEFAALVQGTAMALTPEQVETLSHYILDGQQWMVRGETFDPGAMGRELSRPRSTGKARALMGACANLAGLNTPRKAEFEAFAQRLRGGATDKTLDPSGNRMFWRSDFMAHHRLGYYASVRMDSNRVIGGEAMNGEGAMLWHMADGTCLVFHRGDEYRDIFPVWDWRRIPGVTCRQDAGSLPAYGGKNPNRGATSLAGGVSDGTYGAAAFDYAKGGVTARKAWFFFDDEFVCLGAGIAAEGNAASVTSLNQCLLKGPIQVHEGERTRALEKGKAELACPAWVYHDGVGYVLLDGAKAVVQAEGQSGSWRDINARGSLNPLTMDVFSLWIDHGAAPKSASYAYLVVPAMEANEFPAYAEKAPVEVLCNTGDLQAVTHRKLGLTEAAFYKPGRLEIPGGPAISVDKPCMVLLQVGDNGVRLAVADPQNAPLLVHVELGGKLAGDGIEWQAQSKVSRLTVQLPDGIHAGQSVVRNLKRE